MESKRNAERCNLQLLTTTDTDECLSYRLNGQTIFINKHSIFVWSLIINVTPTDRLMIRQYNYKTSIHNGTGALNQIITKRKIK